MNSVSITPMTKELARRYYREFVLDPDLFADKSKYQPFQYSDAFSDGRVERYAEMGRIFMAVMLDQKPIGEIVLKNIDRSHKSCEIGISLINDSYKNQGYGTEAKKLILEYAFHQLNMKTIFADTLIDNLRSQHVLEKVGFIRTHQDDHFVYFRCDRPHDR